MNTSKEIVVNCISGNQKVVNSRLNEAIDELNLDELAIVGYIIAKNTKKLATIVESILKSIFNVYNYFLSLASATFEPNTGLYRLLKVTNWF